LASLEESKTLEGNMAKATHLTVAEYDAEAAKLIGEVFGDATVPAYYKP